MEDWCDSCIATSGQDNPPLSGCTVVMEERVVIAMTNGSSRSLHAFAELQHVKGDDTGHVNLFKQEVVRESGDFLPTDPHFL